VITSLKALAVSARPRQWTKNLVAFAPLIFSGAFSSPRALALAFSAFAVLCAASTAGYLLNDVRDAEHDRAHPSKRHRPVANGTLTARFALTSAALLAAGAVAAAAALGPRAAGLTGVFILLQIAYSLVLRRVPILDIMTIATGFAVRAMIGAAAIDVADSQWLLASAGLLALFLALAKRRHELIELGHEAAGHRPSLEGGSPILIDSMMSAVTGAVIASYSVYAYLVAGAEGHAYMMATVPFVVFGLFRYLHLAYTRNLGGSPEEVLLSDAPLMLDIVGYVVAVLVVMSLGSGSG
jgi:4-hydroxybenzoate polyprenyltransferase